MTWQDAIALLLVALAAGYLLRQMWQFTAGRRAARCGGCSNCPAAAPDGRAIVSVDSLTRGLDSQGPAAVTPPVEVP